MSSTLTTAFLDRDGVINRNPPEGRYVTGVEEFEPLPGSIEAIARLSSSGLRVIVATNQQGVAKGIVSAESLADIHRHLRERVKLAGGEISEILVCPHLAGTCDCRKPATGLFERARELDPGIGFAESVVIGDAESDMEAARRIGARAIRVTAMPRAAHDGHGPAEVTDLAAGTDLVLELAHA